MRIPVLLKQGEIQRLEHEAAEIIRATSEERLRPLVEAYDAATARARELLDAPAGTIVDSDCYATADQTRIELEEIERKLALKHGIVGDARMGLLRLEDEGVIDDDDPEVREWQAMYSRYVEWFPNTFEGKDLLDGKIVTFDMARARLESIERALAARHGIEHEIRRTLIHQIRDNTIVEDELVADWHDAYASYLNFLCWVGDPKGEPKV